MKNLFLLLLVILFGTGSLYSQQYQPFPEKDAYWTHIEFTGYWDPNALPLLPGLIYHQYMITGADTIINGKTYKIVMDRQYGDSSKSTTRPVPTYTNKVANAPDKPVLALREENKKIYGIRFPFTTEVLLYDFNAMIIGDSVDIVSRFKLKVLSRDSVLIGSVFHKRWTVDHPEKYVIEGVGGFLGYYMILNGQNTEEFACFNQLNYGSYSPNNTCFYIHPYGTPTGMGEASGAIAMISPNPFGDYIKVQSAEQVDIRVYNINGQEVLNEQGVLNKLLDTRSLQQGLYFVKVILKGQTIQTIKLLK